MTDQYQLIHSFSHSVFPWGGRGNSSLMKARNSSVMFHGKFQQKLRRRLRLKYCVGIAFTI